MDSLEPQVTFHFGEFAMDISDSLFLMARIGGHTM